MWEPLELFKRSEIYIYKQQREKCKKKNKHWQLHTQTSKRMSSDIAPHWLPLSVCVLVLGEEVKVRDLNETPCSSSVMDALWTQIGSNEESRRFTVLGISSYVGGRSAHQTDGMFIMCEAWSALAGLGLPGHGDCFSCVINPSRHCWQAWAVIQLVW